MRRNSNVSSDHDPSLLAIIDIETIVPEEHADPAGGFVKWVHHRPLVASMLISQQVRAGQYDFTLKSLFCEPGGEAEFHNELESLIPKQATLCGWNSSGFDLPALAINAIASRSFGASNLSHFHRAYRFGHEHADLADLYGSRGAGGWFKAQGEHPAPPREEAAASSRGIRNRHRRAGETLWAHRTPRRTVDPDFLARRYEETLTAEDTTAYAQVTLLFPSTITNLHHPYEVARAWLREFHAVGKGAPVLAILHAPWRVGRDNPVHLHAEILPKRLGKFGFLSPVRDLATDAGCLEAYKAWEALKAGRL